MKKILLIASAALVIAGCSKPVTLPDPIPTDAPIKLSPTDKPRDITKPGYRTTTATVPPPAADGP